MIRMKTSITTLLLASSLLTFSACESSKPTAPNPPTDTTTPSTQGTTPTTGSTNGTEGTAQGTTGTTAPTNTTTPPATPAPSAPGNDTTGGKDKNNPSNKGAAEQVVTKPESITVLVNKQFALPPTYEPKDLVYPNVPFTFKEQIEKRKMRQEAAKALENLFAGAKKEGIYLAGVSAYRSYATQKTVFNNYVKKDGEEKARNYSAVPGHSEHETGLAIDVSGSDGKCAAEDCFANTKEAAWLAKHASEYGFIIRYLKGKESITGYQYEPWHIRYVGTQLSKEIADKGITLEEYLNAVPVTK